MGKRQASVWKRMKDKYRRGAAQRKRLADDGRQAQKEHDKAAEERRGD